MAGNSGVLRSEQMPTLEQYYTQLELVVLAPAPPIAELQQALDVVIRRDAVRGGHRRFGSDSG